MADFKENPAKTRDFVYTPPETHCVELFRDANICVVVKPSGLLSVPGRASEHYDSALWRVRVQSPEAQAVHRLDMDTSGIMVFALNRDMAGVLGRQFQQREVRKLYLALVSGSVEKSGMIDAPLRCDWERRPLQIVDYKQGKRAVTFYKPLLCHEKSTLVALDPVTGRSHQLRVHMMLSGHPILGDRFYADADAAKAAECLQLHSSYLEFTHPSLGIRLRFSSLPDFASELREVPDPGSVIKELGSDLSKYLPA